MKETVFFCLVLAAGLSISGRAQQLDRNIYIETELNAPLPEVWDAFTTEEGLETFFAPECRIDLRVDGQLDILFFPEAPEGQRGSEGMRILSVLPYRMFSFTWNNPADFPEIRNQRTHVVLKFFPAGRNNRETRLVLIHDGWGDGEIWDEAYRYFVRAWRDVILFRLNYRFDRGPVNWNKPPVNYDQYNIIMH